MEAAAGGDLTEELDGLQSTLAPIFALAPGLPIDADLRAAVKAMVDQHLPRMRGLLDKWADEERRVQPTATPNAVVWAVTLRAYNEMALWQLDSASPAHDKRQQQAFSHPRSCAVAKENNSYLGTLVQVWQQVPRGQRAVFLASEAQLLQRWGTDRAMAPPRPAPSIDETAWRLIDDYVADKKPLPAPLPPLLAWRILAADAATDRGSRENLCVLRQWMLQADLARGNGTLTEAQWLAHRYARAPQAINWWGSAAFATKTADEYPALAQTMGVRGDVVVHVTVTDKGQWVRSSVVQRDLQAIGVRNQRPVAFETLLDTASRAQAAASAAAAKLPPERFVNGQTTVAAPITFNFR